MTINICIYMYMCITITHRNWKHWTCFMAILIFACRGMKSVAVTVAARGSHRAVLLVPLVEFKPPASKWNRWVYIYIIIYIHYIIIYHLSYNIFLFYRSGFLRSSLSSGSCCPWSPLVQGAESSNHRCLHVCWNTSGAQPVTGDRGGPRDHPSSAVPGNLCQRILAIKRDKATAGKTMPCLPSPSHHYRWYMVV